MTFDHGMLTEDIDSSFRSLNTGGKIVYCNQISSSELATDTLHALERQRLRWAQGWFQVTLRHFSQTWSRNELNFHQRVGYFLLLAWREAYYYFACLSIPSLLVYFVRTHFNGVKIDLAFYLLTALTAINFLLTPLEYALCWYYAHPMVREHKSWFFIAVGCSIPYNLYLWFLSLRAHVREVRCTPRLQSPMLIAPRSSPDTINGRSLPAPPPPSSPPLPPPLRASPSSGPRCLRACRRSRRPSSPE